MLKLKHALTLNKDTVTAPNLCDQFDESDLQAIGTWVFEGYTADKQSRQQWEKRTDAAMDLAMQVQKAKSFPWPNCSNIAFPLITIGAMQFHAKAYPTIIQGTDVVKMRVVGEDPDGLEHARASRISTHMSYQVLEEDGAWEEQHDRLLLILGIVGSVFVKTYYDPNVMHNVSELVMARDLVINYWAKSVEDCPRKTHRVPLSRNEIRERVLAGIYQDVLEEPWYQAPARPEETTQSVHADKRKGERPPYEPDETTPFYGLEQHCLLDLDQDGYAEPYIITVEEQSKTVLRIVSRIARVEDIERVEVGKYKGEIIAIRAEEYFTKYSFIPSPDGGIYDIGFGVLLGPLNESVDSIINQLVDAGTMSNTAGGFLARGAKIRGGVYTFSPFGWNRVDSSGDDLRKSVFPLPVREPSNVLFQLLGLLINYTNRVSGANDTMVGENPGQNTPAQSMQTMVEMGMKIYNAIFKRVWRSMKEEFRKLYILNAINLPIVKSFGAEGNKIKQEDYIGDPNRVVPVADPNITSEVQIAQQAMALKQMSTTTPGYNLEAVERRVLKALRVDDLDNVYPGVKSPLATPPPPNPKLEVEQLKLQAKMAGFDLQRQLAGMTLMETHRLNNAKILELQASAAKLLEEAGGVKESQQLQAFNAAIGAMKQHNDTILKQIEVFLSATEQGAGNEQSGSRGNLSGAMESLAAGPSDAGVAEMGQAAA